MVIRTLDNILSMESLPEYDECFNSAKEHDEILLQILNDIFSAQNTEESRKRSSNNMEIEHSHDDGIV